MKVEVNEKNYKKQAVITNEVFRLLCNVKNDTSHFSTMNHKVNHKDFKALVGMGDKIINYLFHLILQHGADFVLFELIRQILNFHPVPKKHNGCLIWITIYWLKWYAESDYYKNNDVYYGLVTE